MGMGGTQRKQRGRLALYMSPASSNPKPSYPPPFHPSLSLSSLCDMQKLKTQSGFLLLLHLPLTVAVVYAKRIKIAKPLSLCLDYIYILEKGLQEQMEEKKISSGDEEG